MNQPEWKVNFFKLLTRFFCFVIDCFIRIKHYENLKLQCELLECLVLI